MANWIGACRSNWFTVRDRRTFIDFLDTYDLDYDEADGAFTLMDRGDGGLPIRFTDDGEEVEIIDEIAPHLAANAVFILYTVGFEKRRHLAGQAIAVHASGAQVWLDLFDIAERARAAFGPEAVIEPDL